MMNELEGTALVIAVMAAMEIETGKHPVGFMESWSMVGPIMVRNNINLSPPTSPVHRKGGPNAGNGVSGYWSASTWHAGVNGRRAVATHPTSAIHAVMRCYASLWGTDLTANVVQG